MSHGIEFFKNKTKTNKKTIKKADELNFLHNNSQVVDSKGKGCIN